MSDWQGNTTQFTYDPDGNLTQVNYPGSSGMTESLTYDNADQFQMSVLSSTAGSLAGNFITDSWPTNSDGLYYSNSASLNGSVVLAQSSFSYNSDTQMTQGLGYSYSYNSAGDITSSGSPGSPSSSSTTTNYSYDAGGELCSSSTTAVSPASPSCENPSDYPSNTFSTYSYNQDGERICSTPKNSSGATCADPNPAITTTYGWNQEGELSSVATPGGNFSYTYNPQGLRQQESSPLGIEYFNWNTQSSTPQLITDGQNAYIYGPQGTPLGNAPIEQIPLADSSTPGSSTYLFSDPEGVRITFNSSGAITSGASYNPYGQLTAGGVSSVTPFGYGGGYTDPTGLIYFVNRYYDPSTGQFISVDPLVGITGQPYQYVNGDPLNFIDPLGLSWCSWSPVGCGTATNVQHKISRATKVVVHGVARAAEAVGHGVSRATSDVGHYIAKHKVAIGEITIGVLVAVGAAALTGGLGDALLIASTGAIEESAAASAEFAATGSVESFLGTMSPIDLAIHAPFVFAPGLTLGFLGAGLFGVGIHGLISEQTIYQNNSACQS